MKDCNIFYERSVVINWIILFCFSPEEKPKKGSSFRLSQITTPVKKKEKEEDDDDDEDDEQVEEKSGGENQDTEEIDPSGSESPRTSALRAMGGNAAQEVINMMNRQEQQAYVPPSEGLSTISEEHELESSASVASRPQSIAPSITVTSVTPFFFFYHV